MFKYIVFTICNVLVINTLFAQTSEFKNALLYKFVVTDYNTIDPIYRYEHNPKRYFHPDDVNYAAELSYFRYINSSFNVGAPIRIGSIDSYSLRQDTLADPLCIQCRKRYEQKQFFMSLDMMGVYKFNNGYLLKEKSVLAPYLTAGLGFVYLSKETEKLDIQIPMGVGLSVKLHPQFYIQGQFEYRASLVAVKPNFNISAGLVVLLGKRKPKPEPTPEDNDVDKDGVLNKDDDCPTVAGLAEFKGCPDTDKDGIMDKEDDCPEEAGLAEFKGCPDRDKDGVMDRNDACPDEFGVVENKGCPLPKEDIKQEDLDILQNAMYGVQFETSKATLKPESFEVLDKVAGVLKRYPNYNVKIHGHTDNVGGDSDNLKLSKKRVETCRDYLVQKGGIDAQRLSTQGFGETAPVATNDTPEGRAKNRRVEFVLVKK